MLEFNHMHYNVYVGNLVQQCLKTVPSYVTKNPTQVGCGGWCVSLIPTLRSRDRWSLSVWSQSGLYTEFQNNQGYAPSSCFKNKHPPSKARTVYSTEHFYHADIPWCSWVSGPYPHRLLLLILRLHMSESTENSGFPLLDVSSFIFECLRSLLSFCKPLHFWNYCHFFFIPLMMFWSLLPVWEITDNAGTETFLNICLHVSWVNKHFRTELTGHRFNPAGKSENPHTLHTCQSFSLAILMGLRKYSQMF